MKFFVLFVCMLLSLLVPVYTFAQEKSSISAEIQDPLQDDISGYQLPYPGILPDNPFYPLKVARDAIVAFFIKDPLKESQFHLLLSDKRLGAGLSLYQKGNAELGHRMLDESEQFFGQALDDVVRAKKQGASVAEQARLLAVASGRHRRVLQSLWENKKTDVQNLDDYIKKIETFSQVAKGLMSK